MDVPGPAPRVLGAERPRIRRTLGEPVDLVTGGLIREWQWRPSVAQRDDLDGPDADQGMDHDRSLPRQQRSGPHLAAQQRGEELLVPRRQEPPAPAQPLRTAGVRQRRRRELLGDPDDPPVIDPAGVAA